MPQGDESETMIVALAGGVGAAKFLRGLVAVMPPEELTIISNTGDDINLFGLHISPDIDIVAYTLSGLVDDTRGWGIQGDTFHSLAMLRHYGAPTWFNLGDRDLATHILRTQRLRAGESLTSITTALCQALGLTVRMLPMCDQPVPSLVRTRQGHFTFRSIWSNVVVRKKSSTSSIRMWPRPGPAPEVLEAIRQATAILICPSNPVISIGPILAVPGLRQAIQDSPAPVVAVSPIIQGATLKGPADKMLRGLGFEVSAVGVAQYYGDLLTALVIDTLDAALAARLSSLGLRVEVVNTIMQSLADKASLARTALTLARMDAHDLCRDSR